MRSNSSYGPIMHTFGISSKRSEHKECDSLRRQPPSEEGKGKPGSKGSSSLEQAAAKKTAKRIFKKDKKNRYSEENVQRIKSKRSLFNNDRIEADQYFEECCEILERGIIATKFNFSN